LLILFGCFSYFNFKDFINYTKSGGRFRRATLIAFFAFVEKNPFSFSKNLKKNLAILTPKKVDYAFLLLLLISASAVVARLVFIENDEYTFSNLWIQKLEIVKNFDNNQWFVLGQNLAVGELAAMNLYANVIGISKEMAIFTFSLFESFLIAAFVFYIVNALTQSKYLGPLIASICFVFFLAFLPVNIKSVAVLTFKVIMCYLNNIDFLVYFLDNIIVIESYSDMPQLLLPEDRLRNIYMVFGFTALLAIVLLMVFFKSRTRAALTFSVFYIAFLFINTLDIMWLDEDLFNQTLTILVPIIIGVNVGLYYKIIKLLGVSNTILVKAFSLSALVIIGYLSYQSYFHSLDERNFKNVDQLKIDLLKAYDQLSTYQMQNTYAVVNQPYGFRLSSKEHVFINYDDFLDSYLKRDSTFQKIKNNKKLLLENPEFILPNSVFVFVSDTTIMNSKDRLLRTPRKTAIALDRVLSTLKQRGNLVNTYFQSESLKVYEIVNRKQGSNLNEMIFKYENSN